AVAIQRWRAEQELRRNEEVLERRVAERTGELTAMNAQLRAEMAERKRAEGDLRSAQAELARVARLTTMGALTASIAHEINQPLAAATANANACLRWLAKETPDLDEVRTAVLRIVSSGHRAAEVLANIRALARQSETEHTLLDVNDAIREILALTRSELHH